MSDKEPTKEEMLEYLEGIMLFLANHGWHEPDKRAVAIRVLIKNMDKRPRIDESAIKGICEAMLKARSMGAEIWPILINWLRSWGVLVEKGKESSDE